MERFLFVMKYIVVAALGTWVALVKQPPPLPPPPSVWVLLAVLLSPRFGLLWLVPAASAGFAQLTLTIIAPLCASVALAVAADWPTQHPWLFALAVLRIPMQSTTDRLVRAAIGRVTRMLLDRLAAPNIAERQELLQLYCGVGPAVANASATTLRRVRSTLARASDAIEAALVSAQQQQRGSSSSSISSFNDSSSNDCAVCMCEPATVVLQPCCHRILCHSCFAAMQNESLLCPLCRLPYLDGNEVQDGDAEGSTESNSSTSVLPHFAVARPISPTSFALEADNYTRRELKRMGLWRAHKAFLASIRESDL